MMCVKFLGSLSLVLAVLFCWAFLNLPKERWQVLAAVPRQKRSDGSWQGLNLTYYGLFNALACMLATAMLIVLTQAVGIAMPAVGMATGLLFAICLPAAGWLAAMVEKKKHTRTIGGAVFVGMLLCPWVALLVRHFHGGQFPVLAFTAAVATAYALGEGVGRLACISFGCCYGRPVDQLPAILRALFRRLHFTYSGDTKKIAYAHGWCGCPVVPVQAITAVVYAATSMAAAAFFLAGWIRTALLLAVLVTQLWRFASEFLRADERGAGSISAYQWMGLAVAVYAIGVVSFFPHRLPASPDLMAGLQMLWQPLAIVLLEALGVFVFWVTGRSQVTDAQLHLQVISENI